MDFDFNKRALFFITVIVLIVCAFTFVQVGKINAQHEREQQIAEEQRLININKSILVPIIMPTEVEAPFILFSSQKNIIDTSLELGKAFNWKSNNASGRKQMNVSIIVWNYKTLDSFEYYDYHWGKIFTQSANSGMTYFLAFVHVEMDMGFTGGDTRMYLPQQDNFALQLSSSVYSPTVFNYEQNQIKQLENTWDYYHVQMIKPYAYEYGYQRGDNSTVPKLSLLKREWLIGGKSNCEDGYIVFEIPKEYNPRMIKILGSFWSFGEASWKITE